MKEATVRSQIPRRLGSFDHLVMSIFEPMFDDGTPDSSVMGVPYQDTWMNIMVRTQQGQFYWMIRSDRRAEPDKEMRFLACSAEVEGNYMKLSGGVSQLDFKFDPQEGLKYWTTASEGPSARATFTNKTVDWKEDDLFELRGKIAGPGVQVMFPTRRDGKASIQTYYNQQYLVEGTLRGEPVKGFVVFEHNYETVPWLQCGWVAGQDGGMMYFANEFDDGSVEMGIFYCGTDKRAGIVYTGNGEELFNSVAVNQRNVLNDQGLLTEAIYDGKGGEWKFKLDPVTATIDRNKFGFVSTVSFGHVTRTGDTRKRVRGWALANAGKIW